MSSGSPKRPIGVWSSSRRRIPPSGAVIADSIQRAVFRSAAEREAVLVMACPGVSRVVESGDELEVGFDADMKNVTLTGPAVHVFQGTVRHG